VAVSDFSAWTPIIWDDQAVNEELQPSAMYTAGRLMNMTSNSYEIPRFTDADVNGGSTLTDDTNSSDTTTLYSYQFNGKFTLDEAEVEDSAADVIDSTSFEWMNSLRISYDNACFGVSAARSTNAASFLPYNSVYYAVTHDDDDVDYTANTNYTLTPTSGLSYDVLNDGLGLAENTTFWNESTGIAIIHPKLKKSLRGIKDLNGRPILTESTGGFPGGGAKLVDDFMGYRAVYSRGAIVTSNFQGARGKAGAAVGNPLIIFANPKNMVRGSRIEPQSQFINANINVNALEHTLQCRARLGFAATVPQSFSVIEVQNS
jgi:hypothetical protein